jgi:hypothetical protein
MIDSVPPPVKIPGAPGRPSSAATAPTTCFSSATMLGNAVGSSMFTSSISAYARCAASCTSARPVSYT